MAIPFLIALTSLSEENKNYIIFHFIDAHIVKINIFKQ